MWMATVQRSSAALGGLARKLAQTIDDTTLARRAARLVQDHAADGQLALATLSRLAREGKFDQERAQQAFAELGVETETTDPAYL